MSDSIDNGVVQTSWPQQTGNLPDMLPAYGGALVDGLGAATLGWVANAVQGVPIIGAPASAALTGWANNLANQATSALSGVAATNTQLQLTGAQPVHVSGSDPTADASVPYASCQDGITVNNTLAILGFVRIGRPAQRENVSWSAYVSGTCTSLVFNVYKMDPATGNLNNVFSSADQSALLTASFTVNQFAFPADVQPVTYGDIYAVEAVATVTGSGSAVYLLGLIPSHSPGPLPQRPYQMGGYRNPTVLGTSPSKIPATTMDNNYVKNVPWFTFGSQANPAMTARHISDPLVNANNWMLASSTGANLIIASGEAVYNGTADGGEAAIYQTPLLTDNFDASFAVSINGNAYVSTLIMASDQGAQNFMSLKIEASATIVANVWNGYYSGHYTELYSAGHNNSGAASYYVTYRAPIWSFYYGSDASGTPFFTCSDAGFSQGVSHGVGHRYFGIMIEHATYTPGAPIVAFSANDV